MGRHDEWLDGSRSPTLSEILSRRRGRSALHLERRANQFSNKQTLFRAAIQRRGSWIVILSVYDADTITIDLSLSAVIS